MSNFANLKRSSSNSLEKLSKAVELMSKPSYSLDSEKYWKPELDKTGNGFFIIRFLPTPPQDGDDGLPWIEYYDHGFQGPTGLWYIEKSLTSIGQQDAIAKFNSELWNSGIEANKEQARKQKRRMHYVSNIYIIKDSKNPENEGQIKLFSYGKKIFEKITQAMNPQFEDDTAIDPFNLWEGANFKLKIRKFEGYQNYDLSEFDRQSPLFEDDEKLEQVWKGEHSLREIIDPKNFKSPEELKSRLERVLGLNLAGKSGDQAVKEQKIEEKVAEMDKSYPVADEVFSSGFDEDDSDLKFFENLLED